MISDTEKELEKIYISYNRVLYKLKLLNVTSKNGKEITAKDLRYAISFMNKKHTSCRWKCKKKNKHYILIEGYYWLIFVYFQKEKSVVDADIDFFETRIKLYENLLKITPQKIFTKDVYIDELEKYFNRSYEPTIRKAINKMCKFNNNYKFIENEKYKISKEGIEWLCKNIFKHKYLDLLEIYKMELTEKYIDAGYPYDIF